MVLITWSVNGHVIAMPDFIVPSDREEGNNMTTYFGKLSKMHSFRRLRECESRFPSEEASKQRPLSSYRPNSMDVINCVGMFQR